MVLKVSTLKIVVERFYQHENQVYLQMAFCVKSTGLTGLIACTCNTFQNGLLVLLETTTVINSAKTYMYLIIHNGLVVNTFWS